MSDTKEIDPHAWAYAVKGVCDGAPIWAYLADNPRALAVARALLKDYLNCPVRPEQRKDTPHGSQ